MKGTQRQHTLAIAAIACIVLLAGRPLILSPLMATWKERSTRLAKMKDDYRTGQFKISRESSIRSQWDTMRANALPEQTGAAYGKFEDALQRWANASAVAITSIRPNWKDGAERTRKVEYRTLDCRVDAIGSLPNLTRFLFEIENDPMGLKVESVDFAARDESGTQLQLAVEVSALQLLKPQSPP